MTISPDRDSALRERGEKHLRRAPQISATWCGDEMVLLAATSGRYFTLNHSGGRMWELLATPRSANELAVCLRTEYGMHPGMEEGTVQRDVVRLLDEMVAAGLLLGEKLTLATETAGSNAGRAR